MRTSVFRVLWILCAFCVGGLAMTSNAVAKPSKKQWTAAEAVLRDHFKAQNRGILDVGQEPLATLGTAFWVRWEAGGGGLVLVRDKDVFATKDMATIGAILKRDDFFKTRQISAEEFIYLLQQLGSLPRLQSDPIKGDANKALNPSWSFTKDGAVFTMYANRPDPVGDRPEPTAAVTKATLTVRSDYTLAA